MEGGDGKDTTITWTQPKGVGLRGQVGMIGMGVSGGGKLETMVVEQQ